VRMKESQSSHSEDYAVDVMKFVMALLVVDIHSVPLRHLWPDVDFVVTEGFARIAVPYFFIASSYYLFRNMKSGIDFGLVRRFWMRILKLYAVWTVLCLPLIMILAFEDSGGSIWLAIRSILHRFLVNGSMYHLWFLYALLLVVPLVAYLLQRGWRFRSIFLLGGAFYSIAWLGSSGHWIYQALVPAGSSMQLFFAWLQDVFLEFRNGLTVGVLFVAIGAYLALRVPEESHRWSLRSTSWKLAILFLLFFLELFITYIHRYPGFTPEYYVVFPPLAAVLFLLTRKIRLAPSPLWRFLRKMSTFLYCAHVWLPFFAVWIGVAAEEERIPVTFCAIVFAVAVGALFLRLSERPRLHFLKNLF